MYSRGAKLRAPLQVRNQTDLRFERRISTQQWSIFGEEYLRHGTVLGGGQSIYIVCFGGDRPLPVCVLSILLRGCMTPIIRHTHDSSLCATSLASREYPLQ